MTMAMIMTDQIINQQQQAQSFRELHIKGDPVVLYNIWDAGSAQAVASIGAKAIASGSHGVANAFGYEDGQNIPLELALDNTRRIVASVSLPVTMDIEAGYGQTTAELRDVIRKVILSGAVGINLEDQLLGGEDLRPLTEQAERIKAIRQIADETNIPLFINARTDLFKNADPASHSQALLDEALARAKVFAAAGADGFFIPGLMDLELIRLLCQKSPLPVNIILLNDSLSGQQLAEAGVSRISYGPIPYLQMIEWLKDKAAKAVALQ